MEPWRATLAGGDVEAAWDQFIERYRRLIFATIRRTLESDEDTIDVFAHVCQALSVDGLARLGRYRDRGESGPRFSTWLVSVVHHQIIDWLRHRDGRRRQTPPEGLTGLQQRIFQHVFVERLSHCETYEVLRTTPGLDMSFGSFLREVAETYRVAEAGRRRAHSLVVSPTDDEPSHPVQQDLVEHAEVGARLTDLMESLAADQRLALQLFVVDELPAGDVARLLGWPDAKAVYNRVYRVLGRLRQELERQGLGPGDL